jgi:hypothetical protein
MHSPPVIESLGLADSSSKLRQHNYKISIDARISQELSTPTTNYTDDGGLPGNGTP